MVAKITSLTDIKKSQLFWFLNIGGWAAMTIVVLIYDSESFLWWRNFYLVFNFYLLGFFASILIRKFFKSRIHRIRTIPQLVLNTTISTLLSSLTIWILHMLLAVPIYFKAGVTLSENISHMINVYGQIIKSAHSLIILLVMFSWIVLYLGINFLAESKRRTGSSQ